MKNNKGSEESEEEQEEEKKEEKEKDKEEKIEEIKETKKKKEQIREIPSEQVQEFGARKPIIPVLKSEERVERLEDSLADIPSPEKKEDKRYETRPTYNELEKEERKYDDFWEGEREKIKIKEITPGVERVKELLPKRRELTPFQPVQREEKVGRLKETKEFVKYESKDRKSFEDELDWKKRERKIKKYKKHHI